jgi:hypothetical protein
MKTLKKILFVFFVNFFAVILLANKPVSQPKNLEDQLVDLLDKDVQLTDSQKAYIKNLSKQFIIKMENSDKKGKTQAVFNEKKLSFESYELLIDSILTPIQRELRRIKTENRIQEAQNKSINSNL